MANQELRVASERFTEVLEAQIEAGEGQFAEPHPFLRTALRGLAKRLNPEIVPMGFVMATELYVHDVQTGKDGFTGEPMPSEVTGMPPMMGEIIKMSADNIASEAFGEEFHDGVRTIRQEIAALAASETA